MENSERSANYARQNKSGTVHRSSIGEGGFTSPQRRRLRKHDRKAKGRPDLDTGDFAEVGSPEFTGTNPVVVRDEDTKLVTQEAAL